VADYPQFRLVAGREYTAEFARQYDAIYAGFYVLLGVLAFPSLIAILNTLAIGVIERTREIGVMRSIGAVDMEIMRSVIFEGVAIGGISWFLGALFQPTIIFYGKDVLHLTDTQSSYLQAALAAHPSYDAARVALWQVFTAQGDHAKALATAAAIPDFRKERRFRSDWRVRVVFIGLTQDIKTLTNREVSQGLTSRK
jgi:cell division protein FtsX